MKLVILADFKKVLKWLLLVLAFTPLIVSPTTLFPYVFGKTILIRLAITALSVFLTFYFLKFSEEAFKSINWSRLKNPIFLSFAFFTALAILSVFFAADPRISFWGDLERGEGFLILFYMLLFWAGSILLFEKEDWTTFFKLSLFSGGVVALDALVYFAKNPGVRPIGSFIGNPAFISVYLLFVIFSALMVAAVSRDNKFWSALSAFSILLSAIALLATKTRGVFVGIFAAVLAIIVYSALNGRNQTITLFGKSVPTKKIGRGALTGIILLMFLFVGTKSSPIWQAIPGFDRLAQISVNDATTQTRLINLGVSLNAVNPNNVGVRRAFLGWGPENFSQAYNRFYNPAIQKYEATWFDRAHNKLMDVLVMNGILGLLVYLTLWFYVFKSIFSSRWENLRGDIPRAPLIFFGVSYFVQNLFLFDQITTYIPLFIFLGYVIYTHGPSTPQSSPNKVGSENPILHSLRNFYVPISAILSVVLIALFVWTSAIPLYQTSLYTFHLQIKEPSFTSGNINKMLNPFNYAQSELRSNLLFQLSPKSADANVRAIIRQVLAVEEEKPSFIKPIALSSKASAYTRLANFSGDQRGELLMKAENDLREIVELAPGRQSSIYTLAENYVAQGKFDEAIALADEMLAIEPDSLQAKMLWSVIVIPYDWDSKRGALEKIRYIFDDGGGILNTSVAEFLRAGYNNYIQSSFIQRDADNFVGGLEQAVRLEELMVKINNQQMADGVAVGPIGDESARLRELADAFRAGGWPPVRESS